MLKILISDLKYLFKIIIRVEPIPLKIIAPSWGKTLVAVIKIWAKTEQTRRSWIDQETDWSYCQKRRVNS